MGGKRSRLLRTNWPQSLFETTCNHNKTNFFHNLLVWLTDEIPDVAKGWLEGLVLERPDLLASGNEWGVLPIVKAANTLPALVFLVFDLVIPENTRKILEAHAVNPLPPCEVCPLWNVSAALRSFRPLELGEANPKSDEASEATSAVVHDITTPEPWTTYRAPAHLGHASTTKSMSKCCWIGRMTCGAP